MTAATLTSKHQITIPASVRKELHVGSGDRIEFVRISEGRYEVIAAVNEISKLKGRIKTNQTISLNDMDKAIKSKAGSL